jgi:hypothetical protein
MTQIYERHVAAFHSGERLLIEAGWERPKLKKAMPF